MLINLLWAGIFGEYETLEYIKNSALRRGFLYRGWLVSDIGWRGRLLLRQKETDKTDSNQTLYYELKVTICKPVGKYGERQ